MTAPTVIMHEPTPTDISSFSQVVTSGQNEQNKIICLIHGPGQTRVTSRLKMAGEKMKLNETGTVSKILSISFLEGTVHIFKTSIITLVHRASTLIVNKVKL